MASRRVTPKVGLERQATSPAIRFQCRELEGGVQRVLARTRRFKTVLAQISFVAALDERAGDTALLSMLLERGTRAHPSVRALAEALEDLYGATFHSGVRKLGEAHLLTLRFEAPAPAFLEAGAEHLTRFFDLIVEVAREPLIERGAFPSPLVNGEKRHLLRQIAALQNDKGLYAFEQCLRRVCAKRAFRHYELGEAERVRACDGASLARHFERKLKGDPVFVHVVGDVSAGTVDRFAKRLFGGLPRVVRPLPRWSAVTPRRRAATHQETRAMRQSQLVLALTTPRPVDAAGKRGLILWNALFGELSCSKLFRVVREEHGMCYAIGSFLEASMGLVFVQAGIDAAHREKVGALIRRQWEAMRDGEISRDELDQAKRLVTDRFRALDDQAHLLAQVDLAERILGAGSDWREQYHGFGRVSREQLRAVGASIAEHTSFFLGAKQPGRVAGESGGRA